jgi:hypothetical protein
VHCVDDFSLPPSRPKNGDWLCEIGTVLKERLLDIGYG